VDFRQDRNKAVVESAIYFAAICLGSKIRASDSEKLNELIKKKNASSVQGTAVDPLEPIMQRRMFHTLLNVIDVIAHPLLQQRTIHFIITAHSNTS